MVAERPTKPSVAELVAEDVDGLMRNHLRASPTNNILSDSVCPVHASSYKSDASSIIRHYSSDTLRDRR